MFETLSALILFAQHLIYHTLWISYKTGQILTWCFSEIFSIFKTITCTIYTLLYIAVGDFLVFAKDVGQGAYHIVCTLLYAMDCILEELSATFESIRIVMDFVSGTLSSIWYFLAYTIGKTIAGIGQFVVMIKGVLLLVGSGMWFAVTLVPLIFVYTSTMIIYYFGCLLEELYKLLKDSAMNTIGAVLNTYEFITDVPFEAFIGLVILVCLVYCVTQFHYIAYQMIAPQMAFVVDFCAFHLYALRNKVTWKKSLHTNVDHAGGGVVDNLCAVCQERNKCILFLPCKHVTVCSPCNYRLQNYNNQCPICRTNVTQSMKVYV